MYVRGCVTSATQKFFCVVGFLFVFFSVSALAGIPQYNSRVWQIEDGLPQNSVQAIVQTQDGYLWLGTQRGLARFDGTRFTVFDRRNVPEWSEDCVDSLYETRDGSLWVGLRDGRISILKNGQFTHFDKRSGLSDGRVLTFFESSDGTLWIGLRDGLMRFVDGRFVWFEDENLARASVRSICEDKEGVLWFGTIAGLFRLDPQSRRMIQAVDVLAKTFLRTVYLDRDGVLWTGTARSGMYRVENGVVKSFQKKDGLTDSSVSAIYKDRLGNVWVGSYGGLSRLIDGKLVPELHENGCAYDLVSTFCEDREGNLWVGAKDGLYRLNPKQFSTYTTQHGLTHNNVMSVLEGRDGTMWFGTWGGGLHKLTGTEITNVSSSQRILNEMVLAVYETRDGKLWLGGDFDTGICSFDGETFTKYRKEDGLQVTAVRVFHEDRSGNLWIGCNSGLFVLKDGVFTPVVKKDGTSGSTVRTICEDRNGDLWIGTENGLWLRSGEQVRTIGKGVIHSVSALYQDSDNVLWVGTAEEGLHRLKDGRFTTFTRSEGMFNDAAYEILEDHVGNLWMSCREGIYRVSKAELNDFADGKRKHVTCVSYGRGDGLVSPDCNSVAKPSGWKSRDGRLWFATSKGLAVTDPEVDLRKNELPPAVLVEEVVADEKHFISKDDSLRLEPGRGDLEFHYTALSFRSPEKNRFKYRLEGFDSDWVDAGTRRVAYYNNIPPGRYQFHVIGCNNDGVWNETGASVELELQPHFWKTWWFKSTGVLVLGGVLFGSYRVRQNRQREIQQLRMRIAADLHDEVGSNLASIALLSQMEQEADKRALGEASEIYRIALTTANSIREIVWFINPDYDTLPEMVSRMKEVAATMLSGMKYEFLLPEHLPATRLPLEVRRNLFLVFKEALHNIVKHSTAKLVTIEVREQRGQIHLKITDDGHGFDEASIRRGNGLKNIRLRLAQLGGTADVQSVAGKGTTICVKVRIT